MAEVQWIKIYTDMFETSRKIKNIEAMPKGDTIIVLWIKLLLLAGTVNDGGAIYITPSAPYTDEGLANELRRPLKIVNAALETFKTYDMIVYRDGILYIKNWEKYQNTDRLSDIREYNRIAKQKSRERQKALQDFSENVNNNVNDKSMTSQRCQDIRKKKEEEDTENISFNHSIAREENMLLDPEYRRKYLGGIGKNVVFLSDEQMFDLLEKLNIEEFDYYVGVIADNELKGHHYKKKTHYQAILDMAMKDRKTK